MRMTAVFLRQSAILWMVTSYLLVVSSPVSAQLDGAMLYPFAAGSVDFLSINIKPDALPHAMSSSGEMDLKLPTSFPETNRWKTDFTARSKEDYSGVGTSGFILQRGEYSGNGFSLRTEMGDISISETPNTADGLSGRGGRLALQVGNSANTVQVETFATTDADGRGADAYLAGATAQISFLAESARFKTIYLRGRDQLNPGELHWNSGKRKGDTLALIAVLEPFKGKFAAEAEIDFSQIDRDTSDDIVAVRDKAYRVRIGGTLLNYRYSTLYERTGPDYRLIAGKGPKSDTEGVTLGMGSDFRYHGIDLKLSRHNDNSSCNPLRPRLYRYTGSVDYTFRGIQNLPLGLQYRRTLVESSMEPLDFPPKETEEEAVSGRLNLLIENWNLGLRMGYSQRRDRLRETSESAAGSLAFSPKFTGGDITVAPDFSYSRSLNYPADLRKDTYAINLDVRGDMLGNTLGFEMKSEFSREQARAFSGRETVGAKLKLACNLKKALKKALLPSVGVKGECNRILAREPAQRKNDYTLLLFIDSNRDVF